MKNRKNLFSIIYIIIIAILGGFFVGRFLSLPEITLDQNINAIQLLSVLTTLFGIVFISIIVDRNKEIDKIKRDLVLKRLEDLYNKVDELPQIIEGNKANQYTMKLKLKYIGLQSVFYKKLTNNAAIDDGPNSIHFIEIHRILRFMTTNTELKTSKTRDKNLRIDGDDFVYSDERITEIDQEIEIFKNSISMEQMRIITF
ncbi:MAG: hypothetical protein IPQ13_00810 [Holophagaceae bacterium]|nr:hypothetical protein [Holophagaceae bacterium]